MRVATLFSGIGAPEQAIKRVYENNYNLVFACEWDKFARQSYAANYDIDPEHFHKDINDLDGTQYRGKVDVIVGGSPCQDFSIAGLRKGAEGQRGVLIWQFFRIIKEVMPPVFIYENVKGMVSDRGGRTLEDFLEVFRSIGYHCHAEVLNTKHYGVPQNRERIYIMGFLDATMYHRFQHAPRLTLVKRLKDVLDDCVDAKYYLTEKAIKYMNRDVGDGRTNWDLGLHYDESKDVGSAVTANISKGVPYGVLKPEINEIGQLDGKGTEQTRMVYCVDGISPTITTMQGDGQEPKIGVVGQHKTVEPKIERWVNSNTGSVLDDIAPSLRASGGTDIRKMPRVHEPKMLYAKWGKLHPQNEPIANTLTTMTGHGGLLTGQKLQQPDMKIRKLAPRECLRLQDFPDTFKIVVSDSQAYKQAGNSMSVNVLEMIFRQIEKAKSGNAAGSLFGGDE